MTSNADKKSSSLRGRLLRPLIAVSACCIAASILFSYVKNLSHIETELRIRGESIVNSVSYAAQVVRDEAGLQRFVTSLGAEHGVALIVVAAGSPPRVVASTNSSFLKRKLADLPDYEHIGADLTQVLNSQTPTISFNHDMKDTIDVSAPLLVNWADRADGVLSDGAVMLHLEGEDILPSVIDLTVTSATFFISCIVIISLLMYSRVSAMVLAPATKIINAIRQREAGEEGVFIESRFNGEMGLIADSLNRMFQSVQKSNKEVRDIRTALDHHAIVSIADKRGTITFVNDKFCEISKYSREELIGKDHRVVNSGYHPKEFMRDLWRTIAAGKPWQGEVKNRAKDGSEYWVATTIVPFLDDSGKPTQYVSIRTDISQQKANEQRQRTLVAELD